jgi:hypothetical protein
MKKLKGSFVGLVVHAAVDGLAIGLTHKIPSSCPLFPSCVAQFQLYDVILRLGISSASHDIKVDVFYICICRTYAHFTIDSHFFSSSSSLASGRFCSFHGGANA